jgi:hypothetical protein
VWRRRKEEKRKSFGRGEHQPSRSVRPSPGRRTRSDRIVLRGLRPRATRLAGLILILSHQVAARAPVALTTDRRVNRRRKSGEGLTTKGPLQKRHYKHYKKCEPWETGDDNW